MYAILSRELKELEKMLYLRSIVKLHRIDIMKFILFCLLFAWSLVLSAQNIDDYKIFSDAAGEHSVLYRGKLPMIYGSKSPNDASTYFAFSTNFLKGGVCFCGKQYSDVALNLNAHTDELYVRDPITGTYIVVNKSFVDSFSLENHRFVHYKSEDHSVLDNGYYEVLYTGNVLLYKKIRKLYFEKTPDALRVVKGFTLEENFYLWKNNRWHRVGTKRDLKKLYPEQSKMIDQLQKTRGLVFSKNDREKALLETITFLDRL